MGRRFTHAEFNLILKTLQESYQLCGPVRAAGKAEFSAMDYIGYGQVTLLDDLVTDRKSWFSPKEQLLPVRETLFSFGKSGVQTPVISEKSTILFLRACDSNGINRLDKIFLENGSAPDFYYQRRRQKTNLFLIECSESFESCFCVSMKTNKTDEYAVALRVTKDSVYAQVTNAEFEKMFLTTGTDDLFEPVFIESNRTPSMSKNKSSFSSIIFNFLCLNFQGQCLQPF